MMIDKVGISHLDTNHCVFCVMYKLSSGQVPSIRQALWCEHTSLCLLDSHQCFNSLGVTRAAMFVGVTAAPVHHNKHKPIAMGNSELCWAQGYRTLHRLCSDIYMGIYGPNNTNLPNKFCAFVITFSHIDSLAIISEV